MACDCTTTNVLPDPSRNMAMIWSCEYSCKSKKINLIFVKTYWCPAGVEYWVFSKDTSISNAEEARIVLKPPPNNHTVFDGSSYFLIFYELCRIIPGPYNMKIWDYEYSE